MPCSVAVISTVQAAEAALISFTIGIGSAAKFLALFHEAMTTGYVRLSDSVSIRFTGNAWPSATASGDYYDLTWDRDVQLQVPGYASKIQRVRVWRDRADVKLHWAPDVTLRFKA